MAVTRADLELVTEYTNEDFVENLDKNSLLNSPIVVKSKKISEKVNSADYGLELSIPVVLEEAYDEGNIGDDSSNNIPLAGINLGKMKAALNFRTKGYGSAAILDIIKPGMDIATIFLNYGNIWREKTFEKSMFALLDGATAKNIADYASDCVLDNGTDKLVWKTIVDARAKVAGDLKYIVMNKATAASLEVQHPEHYLQANGVVGYGVATFAGMRVIIAEDTDLPVDGLKQTIYMLTDGAFVQEFKNGIKPIEMDFNKRTGLGMGDFAVIFKFADVTHLNGHSLTVAPAKEYGYTLTEYKNPALLERIVPQKNNVFVTIKSEI